MESHIMSTINTGGSEKKILIVDRRLIHTYINPIQQQLLPPDQSIKCLKLAFYLLHVNQLQNYLNHTNVVEHSSVSIQELGRFFQTNHKVICSELRKVNHPLVHIKSVSHTQVHFSVDVSFFDSVRAIKEDSMSDKKKKKDQSYYIDLESMKSERSVTPMVLKWFKQYYKEHTALHRDFLFQLLGFPCGTATQRKNAVRTLKRAAEPLGYQYDCFHFCAEKAAQTLRKTKPKKADRFDKYVCHFKPKAKPESLVPTLPESMSHAVIEDCDEDIISLYYAYDQFTQENRKSDVFW
jgi:hypothetical protein